MTFSETAALPGSQVKMQLYFTNRWIGESEGTSCFLRRKWKCCAGFQSYVNMDWEVIACKT